MAENDDTQGNDALRAAQQMDPAVERALLLGDDNLKWMIEKQGIKTTDQLLDMCEGMGLTETLPQSLQDMLDQRNRQLAADAAEADARRKAASVNEEATFAATIAAQNQANLAEAREAAAESDGHGKSYAEMSVAEKAEFLDSLKNMTADQWLAKSDEERKQDKKSVEEMLQEKQQENDKAQVEFEQYLHKTYGDDVANKIIENQKESRAQALKELGKTEDDVKNMDYDQIEALHKRQEKIREQLNHGLVDDPQKQKELDADAGRYDGNFWRRDNNNAAEKKVSEAPTEGAKEEILKGLPDIKDGVSKGEQSSQDVEKQLDHVAAANADMTSKNSPHEVNLQRTVASTAATIEAAHLATGHADPAKTVDHAAVENMDAREALLQKERTEILAQAPPTETVKETGFGDEPVAAATAAPRLTIDADKLATSGLDKLGAPEVVASAEPTPARPRQPSTGMGNGA